MERSENKVKIKFKKLNERAEIPFYAKDGDAGMDLVATTLVRTSKFFEYGTDLAMEIPKGYVGLLFKLVKLLLYGISFFCFISFF